MHLYDRATMVQALLDPTLPAPLRSRIEGLAAELIDWTEYLVVEPGDTEDDIIRHVGFSPFVNPIDGARYGEAESHPGWDWLDERDGWVELILTFGSTFAYILLLQVNDSDASGGVELCKKFLPSAK